MADHDAFREQVAEGLIVCIFIVIHCLAVGILIGGGFLLHHLVIEVGDPKLYDLVPWRYAVDSLDLAMVLMLAVNITRLALNPGGKR